MSAYKIQTPGNYPEENIQHTEHGESLKSRMCNQTRASGLKFDKTLDTEAGLSSYKMK
jgi:hypothetical protein